MVQYVLKAFCVGKPTSHLRDKLLVSLAGVLLSRNSNLRGQVSHDDLCDFPVRVGLYRKVKHWRNFAKYLHGFGQNFVNNRLILSVQGHFYGNYGLILT
jgi:hypothetical protein